MNMRKQQRFFSKTARFFDGKGFYIVLLLCVAVIGASAWAIWSGGRAPEQTSMGNEPAADVAASAPVNEYEPPVLPAASGAELPEETAEYVEDDLRDDIEGPGEAIDIAEQSENALEPEVSRQRHTFGRFPEAFHFPTVYLSWSITGRWQTGAHTLRSTSPRKSARRS
jgi:hypothetical protein